MFLRLTDSYLTGINGGIVNMTLSNIDNWRRFAKAAAEGGSYIAEVYADPLIRDKVVLTFLDALILQYRGRTVSRSKLLDRKFCLLCQ